MAPFTRSASGICINSPFASISLIVWSINAEAFVESAQVDKPFAMRQVESRRDQLRRATREGLARELCKASTPAFSIASANSQIAFEASSDEGIRRQGMRLGESDKLIQVAFQLSCRSPVHRYTVMAHTNAIASDQRVVHVAGLFNSLTSAFCA